MSKKKTLNLSTETAFDERICYLPDDEKELIDKYRRLGSDRKQKIDNWFAKQTLAGYNIPDEFIEHHMHLELVKTATEKGIKLSALKAFIYATENNLPIPEWLKQYFSKIFSKYIQYPDYPLTLDQLIGKTAKQEGGTNEMQRSLTDDRDNFAFYNICTYLYQESDEGRKYNLKEATEKVAALIRKLSPKTGWEPVTANVLQQYWRNRRWNKYCKSLINKANSCKKLGNTYLQNHPFTNPNWLFEQLKNHKTTKKR